MAETATEIITIDAPHERVWKIAIDLESYPMWAHDIKDVNIRETDAEGRPLEVEFRASALGRSTHYTLKYDYTNAPNEMGWSMLSGDIQRSIDGVWRFEPDGEGRTLVRYDLQIDLAIPLPGFVKRRAEVRILNTVRELKVRAEKRDDGVNPADTPVVVPSRRVGIDVGGTKAQAVVIDRAGEVVETMQRPTPRGDHSLDALIDVLIELAEAVGHEGSLGVGVPGLVTRDGVLRAAPNLDGVANFAVAELLSERFGAAVRVDNDATCATVAEWLLGTGRGAHDMILVTLGTGIGGGAVARGSLVRGANGFAGEFGHMVVDPSGPLCPCGRRGCWERYASGSGLAMLARDAATGHRLRDVVRHAGGDAQAVRGEHVQAAAREGDPDALAVIDDFSRWVALGLANLTNALDPEMFVLGGGLAAGSDLYLEPIRRWFGELLYQPHLRPIPRIEFARWGPLAGAVGAALLAELAP